MTRRLERRFVLVLQTNMMPMGETCKQAAARRLLYRRGHEEMHMTTSVNMVDRRREAEHV